MKEHAPKRAAAAKVVLNIVLVSRAWVDPLNSCFPYCNEFSALRSVRLMPFGGHPITGIAASCAIDARGHTAALPSPAMNSLRSIAISYGWIDSLSR